MKIHLFKFQRQWWGIMSASKTFKNRMRIIGNATSMNWCDVCCIYFCQRSDPRQSPREKPWGDRKSTESLHRFKVHRSSSSPKQCQKASSPHRKPPEKNIAASLKSESSFVVGAWTVDTYLFVVWHLWSSMSFRFRNIGHWCYLRLK